MNFRKRGENLLWLQKQYLLTAPNLKIKAKDFFNHILIYYRERNIDQVFNFPILFHMCLHFFLFVNVLNQL